MHLANGSGRVIFEDVKAVKGRVLFRQVLRSVLAHAAETLSPLGILDADEAIHEARRAIKKLRAMIRIVQREISGLDCAAVKTQLRQAAHSIAHLRDGVVAFETLIGLRDKLPPETQPVVSDFVNQKNLTKSRTLVSTETARDILLKLLAGLDSWCPLELEVKACRKQIRRLEKRATKAFRQASAAPSTESLHRWRKRIKDYDLALNQWGALCSPKTRQHCCELAELGQWLGREHDFAVLLEMFARRHPEHLADATPTIEKERRRVRHRAFKLGQSLFG